jgi:quercetin dioxygenase-like cupin family protein
LASWLPAGLEFVRKKPIMSIPVSVVRPGEGEIVLDDGASRVRILEDGGSTRNRLAVAECVLAPHFAGPPQHRHAEHEEGFYIMSGLIRFTVGEEQHDAGPGSFVMVPVGAPHSFANPGDEAAKVLFTFTPNLYVQYFRDLAKVKDRDEIAEVMSRYATELATTYAD